MPRSEPQINLPLNLKPFGLVPVPGPADSSVSSLVALGDEYVQHRKNMLLHGPHGTGKTESLKLLAAKHGLTFKYFSCSTMDPYTELVGVPFPKEHPDGSRTLEMVRPKSVEDAQVLIFDELNRATEATLNALMEITQFQTINGDPLPNLLMVWAAINPPKTEHEYTVEELDRAFEDRFHAYIEIPPRPSVEYMQQHMSRPVAIALKTWWDEHNQEARGIDSYVSPRRLVTIGETYEQIGLDEAVLQALPMRGSYDSRKLLELLKRAKHGDEITGDRLGAAAAPFTYSPEGLKAESREIAAWLQTHPENFETHRRLMQTFANMPGTEMLHGYGRIVARLHPAQLEALVATMPTAKQVKLAKAYNNLKSYRRKQMQSFGRTLAQAFDVSLKVNSGGEFFIPYQSQSNGQSRCK